MPDARLFSRPLGAALGCLALACLALAAAPPVWAEETYVIDSWPADLDKIPCTAWEKTSDGTWALAHGKIQVGGSVLSHVGFKGDTEARLIERNCGKGK
jgi:hypothetical protein